MRGYRAWVAVLLVAVLALGMAGAPGLARANPEPAEPEEGAVVRELFLLGRSLEETRSQIAEADRQIAETVRREAGARADWERAEAGRRERQALLGKRLRYYREQGSMAPLGFLVGAGTLEEFLSRIDLLTRIMAVDAKLVADLKGLSKEADLRRQELQAAEEEQARLREGLAKQQAQLEADIAQREAILASLKERRTAVENQVAAVERAWKEQARPVLETLGAALASLDQGQFAPDSVVISLFPPGATATMTAASLGRFLQQKPELKGLTCRVESGEVSLEGQFDGIPVRVSGTFSVASQTTLRFEPTAVRIREFDVPAESLHELPDGGVVTIDVGAMVRPFSLQGVTLADGQVRIRAGLR
jgi:peptidoglycan hydrolase CwlO-like protein